jgi:hypothetical protein
MYVNATGCLNTILWYAICTTAKNSKTMGKQLNKCKFKRLFQSNNYAIFRVQSSCTLGTATPLHYPLFIIHMLSSSVSVDNYELI